MTRLTKNKTISWVAGTDGDPVTEKSYKVSNIPDDILIWETVDNGGLVGKFQTGRSRPGGRRYDISFSSELYGSDTTTVPTPLGTLFRGCGLGEAVTETVTKFTYTAVNPHLDDGTPSGALIVIPSLKIGIDGIMYHAINCVGSAAFNFVSGQIPTVDFRFLGMASASHDELEVTPAAAYLAYPAPAPVQNLGATITPSGSSVISDLVIPSITYDMGNELDPRPDVNGLYGFSQPIVLGWEPRIDMLVEIVTPGAGFDADLYWKNKTRLDVSFTHESGGGEGHQLDIDFSMELDQRPVNVDTNGKQYWQLSGKQSIESGATVFTMAYEGE